MPNTNETLTVTYTLSNLTIVNFPSSLKLSLTNYLEWKTQIEALLHGLDLYKLINGSHPAPSPTITVGTSTTPKK